MKALYIVSQAKAAGKSAFCAGLGKRFQQDGLTIGYMKPLSTEVRRIAGQVVAEDAELIRRLLNVSDPLDLMAPVLMDSSNVEAVLRGMGKDYRKDLKAAFNQISQGKDVMVLEGGDLDEGSLVDLSATEVAELLSAHVLLIAKYDSDLVVDSILAAKKRLGDRLVGCVLNMVPSSQMSFVQEVIVPFLEKKCVPVLGVLANEPMLLSVSVMELANSLGGEILCAESHVDELVENVMVGAMSVESALRFFRSKPNKVVITGGDRPDIQLAALETSTKCIILTGNLQPSPIVLSRASELGVPMVLVKQDTMTAMQVVEEFFDKARFQLRKKHVRFEAILAEKFNFAALYDGLGIKPKGSATNTCKE